MANQKILPENTLAYLNVFNNGPKFYEMDPVQLKAMLAKAPAPQFEYPEVGNVENYFIPVEDTKIRVKVYQPEGEGPFPAIVYFHGGGWVLGAVESNELANRQLVLKNSAVVISVDYRLAPEAAYPTPLNDVEAAYKWVVANHEMLKINPEVIYLGGDSAGGNLAIALGNRLTQHGITPVGQLLIYPVTNLDFDTDSYNDYSEGYGLDRELMKWFAKYYLENNQELTDNAEIAVLKSEKLAPIRTVIVAAEHDVLRDEGVQLKEKLQEQNVKVDYYVIAGTVHGFYTNTTFFEKEINQATDILTQFISTKVAT